MMMINRMAATLLLCTSVCMAQNATKTATQSATQSAQSDSDPIALEPSAKGEPHTEMLDLSDEPHDPLLEPKPLPEANLSLIGGIASKVDTIHNRLVLEPFGGGTRYSIYFDERTRIFSSGRETTVLAIHPGDRVYAETQLVGAQVFARTLHVKTVGGPIEASGQIIEIHGRDVLLEDHLSGWNVSFTLSGQTKVQSHGAASSITQLHAGSIVDVTIVPGKAGNEAQSITIHATPGESYEFAGTITNLNLRDGVLALDNKEDGNNYELYFDPLDQKSIERLAVGAPATITASFDGKRYRATAIQVNQPTQPPSESSER